MDLLYVDDDIVVCIKPARVLSTDEPGGLPELVREALGDPSADIRTVHRLDRVVSGVMVLARNPAAASVLSAQIRNYSFSKVYLAVIHGTMGCQSGELYDLLVRDKARRMTMVANALTKGVQEARLDYQVIQTNDSLSRVLIHLHTGRTHQIRVQFASRNHPLVGERKYATRDDPCEIALWSHQLSFSHPSTGKPMVFCKDPPNVYPWTIV